MKKLLLTALIAATLAISAGQSHAQQLKPRSVPTSETTKPTPQLVLDTFEFDAGEIEPGTTISHDFTFKNEGEAILKIEGLRPGCGCAVAEADREVAPGATGKVTVTVRIYNEWAGQAIRKVTWVLTNDPLNSQVRLIMKGKVKSAPAGEVEPAKSNK